MVELPIFGKEGSVTPSESSVNGQIPLDKLKLNQKSYYYLQNSAFFVLYVLLLYIPSQQLWSLRDGQFT